MLDTRYIATKFSCFSTGDAENCKVWLVYRYTLFKSNTWMLYISLIFYECFVDVTGKHTARISRSGSFDDRDNVVKSNLFAD